MSEEETEEERRGSKDEMRVVSMARQKSVRPRFRDETPKCE